LKKSWLLLPSYVREAFNESDDVARCPGGGWLSRTTGTYLEIARSAGDAFARIVKTRR
jgi:hypothetical protein